LKNLIKISKHNYSGSAIVFQTGRYGIRVGHIVSLLLIAFAMMSCRPANLQEYDKPYFDFDSLVNKQIQMFSTRKDSIRKVAELDAKKSVSSFVIDSTHLAHEWDVFRQLDWINKPLFKGNYEITEGADTKSNLMVRSYVAKKSSNRSIKFAVPFVHFYYQNDFKNLKRIESQYEEQNALYYTNRKLSIVFDDAGGKRLINYYTIKGSQKMILSDSVKFSIQGSIF